MVILRFLAFVVLLFVATHVTGCGNSVSCVDIDLCAVGLSFQFEPAIHANHEIAMTIFGDDANYTSTYAPALQTGFPLILFGESGVDAGAFLVTSASVMHDIPKVVTYNVTADAVIVAQGTITPRYQQVTKGGAGCAQTCTEAQVKIPVTQ